VIFGLIGGLSIIFSYLTGIGIETYGDYAFGIKSFFNAQNDISLALLLSLNLTIYMMNIVKEKSFYVISALVVSIGLLLLGTRAGMIGVAIVWLLNILGLLVLKDENMRIKLTFKVIISIFSFFVIGVFLYYTYQLMTEYSYMLEKFNFEDKSIFGVRGILIQAAIVRIENFNLLEILFGYGKYCFFILNHITIFGNDIEMTAVEVDYLDTIGAYGYFLGGLILVYPIYIFLLSIKNFLLKRKLLATSMLIGMIIFIGHSIIAGHALVSPIVGTIISTYYYISLKYYNEVNNEKNTIN
jgi:hypothetical protein